MESNYMTLERHYAYMRERKYEYMDTMDAPLHKKFSFSQKIAIILLVIACLLGLYCSVRLANSVNGVHTSVSWIPWPQPGNPNKPC